MQLTVYINAGRKAKLGKAFPKLSLREAIAAAIDKLPDDTITITTSEEPKKDNWAEELMNKIEETDKIPQRQGDASAYPPSLPLQQEEDEWEIVEDKGEDW